MSSRNSEVPHYLRPCDCVGRALVDLECFAEIREPECDGFSLVLRCFKLRAVVPRCSSSPTPSSSERKPTALALELSHDGKAKGRESHRAESAMRKGGSSFRGHWSPAGVIPGRAGRALFVADPRVQASCVIVLMVLSRSLGIHSFAASLVELFWWLRLWSQSSNLTRHLWTRSSPQGVEHAARLPCCC